MMEVVRHLMKGQDPTEKLAVAAFAIAALYAIVNGTAQTLLLGVAATLIILGALPRQIALAFLIGASAILLVQVRSPSSTEGFADVSGTPVEEKDKAEKEKEEKAKAEEKAKDAEEKAKAEKFSGGQKPMLPDNRDRKEMLELGKPYKLPSENDDKGFHMDAGTTFLNAYKALKPDQIAAMTKDTQELLATQKSLVAMLDSFGPLMKDMNKITGFFGPGN